MTDRQNQLQAIVFETAAQLLIDNPMQVGWLARQRGIECSERELAQALRQGIEQLTALGQSYNDPQMA